MKIKNRICIVLIVINALCACNAGSDGNGIVFDNLSVEKTTPITNEAGAPSCHVKLELACAKEDNNQLAGAINETLAQELFYMEGLTLKQAADSFANDYSRNYVRNFATLYREDRNDAQKRAWYEYHYYMNSKTQAGKKGIIVYTTTIDYYEGGMHGINQKLTFNFDEKSGKVLKLSDVFSTGFEQCLNDLLLQKLEEEVGAKDIQDLHIKGYLYSMDMFAPENFIMGEDGITFIYNPYEIASYSMGMVELELKYDDLEEILTKE